MERSRFPFLQDHSTVLAYNNCVLKLKLLYQKLNHVRKEILTKALTKNSAHNQIEDAIRAILYNLEREFELVTIQTENFVIHPEEYTWPLVSSQKLSHLVNRDKNYRFHSNLILLNIYCKDPFVVSKQISKEKNDILNKILIEDNRISKNIAPLPERSSTSHNKPETSGVSNDLNCSSKINTLILATPRLATNDVGSQSPRKHNKIVELLHKHDSSAVQKSQSSDSGMNIASSSKKLRGTHYKSTVYLSNTTNKQSVSSPKKTCTEDLISTEQSIDFETDETTSSKGSSVKSIPLKRKSKEANGKSIQTKLDYSPVKKRKLTKSDCSAPVDTSDINYNISQGNSDTIILCPEKRYDLSETNVTNVNPLLRSVANKNHKTSNYDISELNDKQYNHKDKFIRDVNKEKKNYYNLSEPIFQSSSKQMSENCVIEISKDGSIIEEAESTERCKDLSNETSLNGSSYINRSVSVYKDKNTTSSATKSSNRKKMLDKEINHAQSSNNVLNSETQAKDTSNRVHNSTIETRSKKTVPLKSRTTARNNNKTKIVKGNLSDISSSSMSSDTETKKHEIKSKVFKQAGPTNRPHTRSRSRESNRQTRSSSSLSTRSGQRHTGMSSKQSAPKAENHYPKVSVWLSKVN